MAAHKCYGAFRKNVRRESHQDYLEDTSHPMPKDTIPNLGTLFFFFFFSRERMAAMNILLLLLIS